MGQYLMVMKLHVEVILKMQRMFPDQTMEGQRDGAIIQQEVKHILVWVNGTHLAI